MVDERSRRRVATPNGVNSMQRPSISPIVPILLASLVACGSSAGSRAAAEGTGDISNPAATRTAAGEPRLSECGSPALTTEGLAELDRLPYLQRVSSDSAEVLFTLTDTRTPESLQVTLPDGRPVADVAAELDASDASGRQQLAAITGLQPGQVYCYSIDGLTQRFGFRTAPSAGSGAPVRFAVFGDSGGGPLQGAVRDQLETVDFDLMLHVGDIAYGSGTLAQLESQFFDEYSSILENVPVFPASGNHDYDTSGATPFREVFALPENGGPEGVERWYSFDWGDVHFVALDTEQIDPAQTSWLEDDLANHHLPWTVAYLHRPPYSSGEHGGSRAVQKAFSPLFARYGVQVVFSGHDHDYERTTPIDGVTYIVTGGGGHGTRPVGSSSYTAYSEDVLHFVYAEVTGDQMLLHAIDATGREFDSARIQRGALAVPQ
jgi:hypothetical protein